MVSSLNANRNVAEFQRQYAMGKSSEKLIKSFLISQGFRISNPTLEEDKFYDVDVWVGNTPVSIKTQHKSLGHADPAISFELEQKLTGQDIWERSWFYNGQAEKYLVYRGTELMLLDKKVIQDYVELKGWDFVRTLSYAARSYIGGTYRYDNARSGWIRYGNLPVEHRWTIPQTLTA